MLEYLFSDAVILQALRPLYSPRHVVFWSAVYLSDQIPAVGPQVDHVDQVCFADTPKSCKAGTCPGIRVVNDKPCAQVETLSETSDADLAGPSSSLPPKKTRSCDDLVAAAQDECGGGGARRLSDPNIAASDPHSLLAPQANGLRADDAQVSGATVFCR